MQMDEHVNNCLDDIHDRITAVDEAIRCDARNTAVIESIQLDHAVMMLTTALQGWRSEGFISAAVSIIAAEDAIADTSLPAIDAAFDDIKESESLAFNEIYKTIQELE